MMMLTTPGQKLQMPSSLDGRPGLVPTSHGSTSDPKSAKKMLLQHKTFQKNVFDLKDAWMLFLIYLAFSKFSQVKLGADDSVPEYNNITWWAKSLIAPNHLKSSFTGFQCSLPVVSDLACFSSLCLNQSPITQVIFAFKKAPPTNTEVCFNSYKLLAKNSTGENRFTANPSLPDNRLAQEAMNITLYHW